MSYRDHLKAQKKYIQTKKEALRLKKESRHKPPPVEPHRRPAVGKFVLAGIVIFLLLSMGALAFFRPQAPAASRPSLNAVVLGNQAEFLQLKNWLEPEILANGLEWMIEHSSTRPDLLHRLVFGPARPDLLIVGAEFAAELFSSGNLIPLLSKDEQPSFQNCFMPLWEPQPFCKNVGLVIPRGSNIDQARHLCTVLKQFAPPFTPLPQLPL